ncbi:MAG: Fe-S-cluster containining protein [Patiriisocius sp.]|jgi:Fe-S-cluster containining protein
MDEILDDLENQAAKKKKENHRFFERLKKKPPKDLDDVTYELHEKEFENISCLNCANCCKTTGPLFTQKDIDRISQHLKMSPGDFVSKYLRIDEDNDYVLQTVPCSFLLDNNECSIYDIRPKACREFPHTDRKKFSQLLNLTLINTAVCPAVYNIVEELKSHYKKPERTDKFGRKRTY